MFYSIDLLSPKGALGNVWVMMLLFRDAIFVRVGSFPRVLFTRANEFFFFFFFFFAYLKRRVVLRALTTTKLSLSLYRF